MATTTSTTLTELVNSEVVSEAVLSYALDSVVIAPFVNMMDLRGKASNTGAFPKWVLDTATDITNETTDLSSETLETTEVTISAAEVGVRRDISDTVLESSVIGASIFDFVVKDAANLLAVSLDDDLAALLGAFSTTVGGGDDVDLNLANMAGAMARLRKNKMRGAPVYILDDHQAEDLQAAQLAATATTIGSFMAIEANNTDYLGTFMGAPVYSSGLCDTSSGGAAVDGACFIRGDTDPASSALGMVLARDIRVEQDRDVSLRSTIVVSTARWGVGEISDASGVSIITDA